MAVEFAQRTLKSSNMPENNSGILTREIMSGSSLLHELQLGEKLNTSVVETRRADFTLMLAMLADDVREQSLFLLPKKTEVEHVKQGDSQLRKQFNLPEKSSLALSSLEQIPQFNQAQSIVNENLASIHLENAIKPKPLAFRDNNKHINTDVIQNTSLLTQLKHQQMLQDINGKEITKPSVSETAAQDSSAPLNQPLSFNAKAWIESVQQSLVKAPLLS